MSDDFVERKDVIQWLDYMTGRLDEYEIERNEYLSAYSEQAPASFRFFQDVVLGFAENTLLMDNLAAGREEVQYVTDENGWTRNRLRLHTIIEGNELRALYKDAVALAPKGEDESDSVDGTGKICYPDRFPYLLRHRDFNEDSPSENNLNQALKNKEIVGGEDKEIVLPNVHVFYSILENFIRNSAKHAEHLSSEKQLDVYLYVTDPGDDSGYYNLFLYDDVSEVKAETAVRFQRTIESKLVESDGEKDEESSLGISDMKFSSFLMVDPAPGEMTEEKLSSHLSIFAFHGKTKGAIADDQYTILRELEDGSRSEADRSEALKEKLDNGKCNFGYCFKLAKSKKVCWIGSYPSEHEADLRPHGIYRYDSLDDFRNPDDAVTMAAFDFAVFEPVALTGVSEEVFERALLQLPYRVLLAGSVDDGPPWLGDWFAENERRVQQTEADLPALQSEQLLRWCWREWLRRWHVEEGQVAQVHLYMENEEGLERWSFDEGKKSDFCNVELNLHSGASSGVLPCDEGSLIVYDRHGGLLKTGFQGPNDGEKIRERILESSHFCNSFDKNSSDFAPLFYPPADPENREYMLYQLVEAGLLRVFVLDERIADLAQKGEHKSMENALPRGKGNFWHQAAASNVFLITHVDGRKVVDGEKIGNRVDLKLDVSDGVSIYSSQEDLDVDEKCADVLIIHRTFVKSLAERLLNGSVKSLIDRLRKSIPWVIVNSGTSHSLDSEVLFKFMPFSQLDNQIQEVGLDHGCVLSKIQLAKRIMTLTRIQ